MTWTSSGSTSGTMRLISSTPTCAVTRRSPDCSAILVSPSCHVYRAGPGRPARAHALSAPVPCVQSCHLPVPGLLACLALGRLALRAPVFCSKTGITLCDLTVTLDNLSPIAHTESNGAQAPRTGNGSADFPVRCPKVNLGAQRDDPPGR